MQTDASLSADIATVPAPSPAPLFGRDEDRQALIVIPTVGTPSVLIPAFAKLLQHLDGVPVHICVALNPKNPEHGEECAGAVLDMWRRAASRHELPPRSVLTLYRHPAPCGFGGALNRGIVAAAGGAPQHAALLDEAGSIQHIGLGQDEVAGLPDLTIFYNDDLEAAPGWLAEMLAAARSETVCDMTEPAEQGSERRKLRSMAAYGRVGLVGPCTNNAAGYQKIGDEEGKAWRKMGTLAYAREWRAANTGYVLTADFLSGFCMGITRDCLLALWGANEDRDGPALFDEATYPIAGYEDNDLCVRAMQAGYRSIIAAGSFVGHIGHQTFDAMFPDAKRGMRNRLAYYEKWAPWVAGTSKTLVAVLRVKVEVPNDLRLLRATLGRLGELVDGVALLMTAPPEEVLKHPEGRVELNHGLMHPQDRELLQGLAQMPAARSADRGKLLLGWVKACLNAGAQGVGRPQPSASVGFWDRGFNERDERNTVLHMAETMRVHGRHADWLWSIDHDEVVEPRITRALLDRWMRHPDPLVSQYDQGYYTPWTDDHTLYRIDRPWGDEGSMLGGQRGWRLYRINRAAPGRIIAGTYNGLHCGNIPTSDGMSKRCAAIRILHLGYARREDRIRKHARYLRQDPNPDKALVGGSGYEHLINEDVVAMSSFNERNGIGLHMLAHEGEDLNGVMQHLDSLHGLMDMAVVVWTSPTTDTLAYEALARAVARFGAVVIHHPIDPAVGGLGAARNAGIDYLQEMSRVKHPAGYGMGWSLFFDPDEMPPQEAMPALRRMADAVDCWAWLVPFENVYQDGGVVKSEAARMARLLPEMRMDGAVHEAFGEAICALKRKGYRRIQRYAPFTVWNIGLSLSAEQLQAKYDRYARWAMSSIVGGAGRVVDWTTVGLYLANEGLVDAPATCYAHAMSLDPDSFLPAQFLAEHYQRLSRIALKEMARRLDGHPRIREYKPLLDLSTRLCPDHSGTGTVGQPGHRAWTEEQGMALIEGLMQAEQVARAAVPPSATPPETDDPAQAG